MNSSMELAKALHNKIQEAPGLSIRMAVVTSLDIPTKTAYLNLAGSTTSVPASFISVPGIGSTVLVLDQNSDLVVIGSVGNGRVLNLREMGVPLSGPLTAIAIQAVIDNSQPGDTIYFDRWFTIDTMIIAKERRAYIASEKTSAGLRQADGASITALLADESWFNNTTDHGAGMRIEHMGFDANRDGDNTLGHGLIIMNWPTLINDIFCVGMPEDNHGILLTSAKADNSVITGKLQEINIMYSKFDDLLPGSSSIRGIDYSNASELNDGFIHGNVMWGGDYGIFLDNSAGWDVSHNHPFGQIKDGIRLEKCFATTVMNNYCEQYGLEADVAGYYAGIVCSLFGERQTTVGGNSTYSAIPAELAGGNIRGIVLFALTGQTCDAVSYGNSHRGGNYTGEVGQSNECQSGATLAVTRGINHFRDTPTHYYDSTGVTVT